MCSTDSGTPDSGTPDAGPQGCNDFVFNSDRPIVAATSSDPDAGVVTTIAQIRYGHLPDGGYFPYSSHVLINNATVQAVSFVSADGGTVGFWIADDSDAGIYVYKRGTDTITANPVAGDVVNIDGAFTTQPKYYAPEGYRYSVGNLYYGSGNAKNRPMIITPVASGTASPLSVDASCAMDAQGGTAKLYQDSQKHAGQLIHINGPLTLTEAHPTAMAQVTELIDGGALITSYRGFEVSGGILVDDSNTYSNDGGFGAPGHCDWAIVADGGATVTFPNGITGVWDSYTMHPCIDNGTGGCKTSGDNGYVPNAASLTSDGGNQSTTFALFPRDCTDLPGDAGI